MGKGLVSGVAAKGSVAAPLAAALGTALVGCSLGYASLRGVVTDASSILGGSSQAFLPTAMSIAVKNLATALLLYSGVSTLGVSTLVAMLFLSGYVGATFSTAVSSVGVAVAAGSIALYAPLEMCGLLVAATAGLMPASAVLTRPADASRSRAYLSCLPPSLRVLCAGGVVIIVAAAVEAAVIVSRG